MRLRPFRLLATLAHLLLLNACAQPSQPSSPTPPRVQGRVVFAGEIPPTKIITPHPPLDAVFPQGIPSTRYRVSPDRGLAEVVVSIVNPPADRPAPPTSPQFLSISNTISHPRVLAVHTNQPVQFSIRGRQMFNLSCIPTRGQGFNKGLEGNVDFERWFPEAGARYRITDNIYTWLLIDVWTFDHPWFAVTDRDGAFAMPPLPPGRYTLQIDHRWGGSATREIEVPATEPLTLTVSARATQAGR